MSLGSKLPADGGGGALRTPTPPYNLLWVTPVQSANQIPTKGTPNYRFTVWVLCLFFHFSFIYRSKERGLVGTIESAIFWRLCRRFDFCEVPVLLITSHLGKLSVEIEWGSFSIGGPLFALHLFLDAMKILLFRDYSLFHSPFCDPCNMNMVSSPNA